ncbi:MAG: DNA polymerase III subunit alpha [bacterium]
MPQSDFIHLHNHTYYSLLDGAQSIKDLVGAAKKHEMSAVAMTDHGVMFGAYDFYKAAKAEGIKPIIGCEIYIVSEGSRYDREAINDPSAKRKVYHHLILLAKNNTGYQNLLKLVSKGYTEGFYYKPRIDLELLSQHHEGLIAMSACAGGVISPYLIADDFNKAKQVAGKYKEIFGTDFYVELQNHHLAVEQKVLAQAPRLAKEMGLQLVCTNDVHYSIPAHAEAHNVLMYIKDADKDSPPDVKKLKYGTPEYYFRSPAEMRQLFGEFEGALENTLRIADECNVTISKDLKLPSFPIPPESGVTTLDAYLEKVTWEGIEKRYRLVNAEVKERTEFELGVIKKMGYPGYFLIVQDFIDAARKQGVSVGPGRGSAAGSIVAYALGITAVDPIKYNLLFERFLNPERVSMPDIDIDFSDDKREKVIEYVRDKYGKESVAQIITFSTLSARAVLKDVGRVMGVPLNIIGELTNCIPVVMGRVTPLKEAMELPEMKDVLKRYSSDDRVKQMLEYAKVLEGFARSASRHAAGVVIAPGNISNYVPLYKSPNEEEAVTQFTMKDVEDVGLLKMDFLGLRTLSIIDTTLDLIEKNHGIRINIDDIPLDDKKTYELFGRGDTIAVFQFDSPPMQNYMRALKPENIEDLSSMNALYRPGPMEYIPEFIDRKQGRKKVEYLHPLLEPILAETYGVIVVQEQVMRIARDLAGFSLAKADEMRRAMGKKDLQKMEAMKAVFIEGCLSNNIPDKTANEIFDRLAKFASYGFNKSHSLAYSLIAYQTAYLKANYTSEFLAANMTHEMGSADYIVQLIDEAKKYDIPTLPPDVNSSELKFTATKEGIRFGLAGIKNVGGKATENIVKERELNGPFTSIYNFTGRLDNRLVNKRAVEALIESGAFDSTKPDSRIMGQYRADLITSVEHALAYGAMSAKSSSSGMDSLFDTDSTKSTIHEPSLASSSLTWSEREMLSREKVVLGFYVSGHPLERYRVDVQSFATHRISELADMKQNDSVFVIGVIVGITRKLDRNGKAFAIVSLEDFSGKIDCVFWSDTYRDYQNLVVDEQPITIQGKVRKNSINDVPNIVVSTASDISGIRKKSAKGVNLRIESRDEFEKTLEALKQLCLQHHGNCTTYVTVENLAQAMTRRYKLPDQFAVASDDKFVSEFEAHFGKNRLLFIS